MTLSNRSKTPPTWTDQELANHAHRSLLAFVERRLEEPQQRYSAHIAARRSAIQRLFKLLSRLDPANPDPALIRRVLLDGELFDALRYVTGPPVSADDLSVLVLRSLDRLTKTRIKSDPEIVLDVLDLICRLADPSRFPWVADRRSPALHELKMAIRSTAALHATQTLQTERRGYGKTLERQLEHRLAAIGYSKARVGNRGRVDAPTQYPSAKTFYGECTVYGRKTDLLIGLVDGRLVAVEAKDSSSALNSVKRVLNDTAAKAEHWTRHAGKQIVPVAVLSGVFRLENLLNAQASGLYLAWAHDLDSFIDWLATQ